MVQERAYGCWKLLFMQLGCKLGILRITSAIVGEAGDERFDIARVRKSYAHVAYIVFLISA